MLLQELELVLWHFEANYSLLWHKCEVAIESESVTEFQNILLGFAMFTKACMYIVMAIVSNLLHTFSKITATYALNSRKHIHTTAKHLQCAHRLIWILIIYILFIWGWGCIYVALLSPFWRSPTSAACHNFQTIHKGNEGCLYARKCLWRTT